MEIFGKRLTTFEIDPDGDYFRLNFSDTEGKPASVTLPTDCLNELVMTMPRIATTALRIKHNDSSLRLVYPLGDWQLEEAPGHSCLILTMKTPDGFSVSFKVGRGDIEEIAELAAGTSVAMLTH